MDEDNKDDILGEEGVPEEIPEVEDEEVDETSDEIPMSKLGDDDGGDTDDDDDDDDDDDTPELFPNGEDEDNL
jgi:hypothetical protein